MMRKVELWVVCLLALAVAVAGLAFSSLVLDASSRDGPVGPVRGSALALASVPIDLLSLLNAKDRRVAERAADLAGRSGWSAEPGLAEAPISGYLLLSRTDIAVDQQVIELVDLSDFSVRHRWVPDADVLLAGVPRASAVSRRDRWNRRMFEYVHPLLMPDGGLIVKDHQSPLFRLDRCGTMLWRNPANFHHSTMPDADGNLWVPSLIDPPDPKLGHATFEDALSLVSPDGQTLDQRSLWGILSRNGLRALFQTAGTYDDDGLHLNDIEPVLADGPFWRTGDLFLSMRQRSLVALYRPETDRVIWWQVGPWLAQHDVEILDDHRIAVFNNNAYDSGKGWYIDGHNQLTVHDFRIGQTSNLFDATMKAENVASLTEGLLDFTASGHVVIEDENRGRILVLDGAGQRVADYVNRTGDGEIYGLAWSRVVPQALGDAALSAIATAVPCPVP